MNTREQYRMAWRMARLTMGQYHSLQRQKLSGVWSVALNHLIDRQYKKDIYENGVTFLRFEHASGETETVQYGGKNPTWDSIPF